MIQFGLRLHDAEKLPIEQVLPLVRQKGFSCVHLALSKSLKEVPNTPSALTPGYAAYLRRLFAKNELDIAVLGNYLNLAHPDTDALHAIQEKYYAHIRFASLLGCGMVGTETGAPNAEYKFCPECRSDAALATFIKNFKPVVRCAEQYGVTIAIEPVVRHIVYDARRARTVLDEIGSPNLQILLDPVNLLNMENVDQREEVFAEAIELLGIATCHTMCPSQRVVRICDQRRASGVGAARAVHSPVQQQRGYGRAGHNWSGDHRGPPGCRRRCHPVRWRRTDRRRSLGCQAPQAASARMGMRARDGRATCAVLGRGGSSGYRGRARTLIRRGFLRRADSD